MKTSLQNVDWSPIETIASTKVPDAAYIVFAHLYKSLYDKAFPRGLGGVVGLMPPLALTAAFRVPYTTSPCSDLGQVVNLSLSVA